MRSSNGKNKFVKVNDIAFVEKTIDGSYHVIFGRKIRYNKICDIINTLANLDVLQQEYANILFLLLALLGLFDADLLLGLEGSENAERPGHDLLPGLKLAPHFVVGVAPPPPAAAQAVYKYGKGRVFRPNPVNALKNTALKDNADADGPAFTPAYRKDWLRDLTYNGTTGTFSLQGPWVRVNDAKESPFLFPTTKGLVTSRDLQGRFMFVRTPDQFEHVMAYYHIDRNQRYIQGLGILGANQRQILVDPHAGATRYVPSPVGRGFLAFATAGVDDAESTWVYVTALIAKLCRAQPFACRS